MGKTGVPYSAQARQQTDFAIATMCRVLQVSASGSRTVRGTESTPTPVSMRLWAEPLLPLA